MVIDLGKPEATAVLTFRHFSRAQRLVDLLFKPVPLDTLSKPGENPTCIYLDLRARSASYTWRLRTSRTTGNGRCTDVYNTIGEGGAAVAGGVEESYSALLTILMLSR